MTGHSVTVYATEQAWGGSVTGHMWIKLDSPSGPSKYYGFQPFPSGGDVETIDPSYRVVCFYCLCFWVHSIVIDQKTFATYWSNFTRQLGAIVTVAFILGGCSTTLGTAEHDLSQNGFTSEFEVRIVRSFITPDRNRFHVVVHVPKLTDECKNAADRCEMPGPFHLRLLDIVNQVALVDQIIEAPINIGYGGIGQQSYVLARLLEIRLLPGTYKLILKNLSDRPEFKGMRARLAFQYSNK